MGGFDGPNYFHADEAGWFPAETPSGSVANLSSRRRIEEVKLTAAKVSGICSLVATALVLSASAAFASPADPTNGAFTTEANGIKDTALGVYFPVILGIVAAVVAAMVGLAWLKKSRSHAAG